jgi:hypothetical protein
MVNNGFKIFIRKVDNKVELESKIVKNVSIGSVVTPVIWNTFIFDESGNPWYTS